MNDILHNIKDLASDGTIFTVVFTKKDGTIREMTCRLGVKKHLKGGELKYNPNSLGYLIVFDMQKQAYRTINTNTILTIKLKGITYDLVNNEIAV